MGLRFHKSKSFGPFRINFSKSGIGWSVGSKWFRYTKKAGGGTRTTASIPGSGISYVEDHSARKRRSHPTVSQKIPSTPTPKPDGPHPNKGGCLMWGISVFLILCFFAFFISLTGILCLAAGLLLLPIAPWQSFLQRILPFGQKANAIIAGILFVLALFFYSIPLTAPAQADIQATPTPAPIVTATPLPSATSTPEPTPTPSPEVTPTPTPAPTVSPEISPVPDSEGTTGAITSESPATTPAPESEETPVPTPQETMVWIAGSGNGKKYHSYSGCSNMSNPVEISLSDAQARDYEPCKRCYG